MMADRRPVGLFIADFGQETLGERMLEDVEMAGMHNNSSVPTRPRACNHRPLGLQPSAMSLKAEDFRREIEAALHSYEKFIICVEKTPDQFLQSLQSLMDKAIDAYVNRAEGLRHGIALDKHVTIILSETGTARPICGIYFNLHSPYRKKKS